MRYASHDGARQVSISYISYKNVICAARCRLRSVLNVVHQATRAPIKVARRRPETFNDVAPLEGALVVEVEAAVDPAVPLGEVEPEVLLVLALRVDEPVLVDIVVWVDAPVVDESADVVAPMALVSADALVMVAAVVIAAELAGEVTALTVFLDSTTNCAE